LPQKAKPFILQDKVFYRFGQDIRFCHILQLKHAPTILQELHNGVGGHSSSTIIVRKILDVGY
jgi:hypothetical protein